MAGLLLSGFFVGGESGWRSRLVDRAKEPSMIRFLKVVVSGILVFMIFKIVETSLQSNLFEELPALIQIPWMEATLWDFYANVFVIFLWILFKEKNHLMKIIWLVLLVTLGSVASCIYLLKELLMLQKGEGLKELLTKQNR